ERANPSFQRVTDPFTGAPVVVVPPLHPDVAIVHVQRADENGNAQIWGILGEQKEAAFAARHVIVTAEEIVDEKVIRSDPNRTIIPDLIVDAVARVPYAAHPSYTQGYYDRDNDFYLAWDEISESPEKTRAYLDEWVFGVEDRAAYWEKLGEAVHARLGFKHRLAAPVDYGEY
ncbi:MAG TPA: CoA-transferase, partial [Anaerolineaceae bacterium]